MSSNWPLQLFLALVIKYLHTATIIYLQIHRYKIIRVFYIEHTSSFAPSLYGIHTNRCLQNINKKNKKKVVGAGEKSLKPTQDKKVYSLKSPTSPFWRLSRSYALYRQAGGQPSILLLCSIDWEDKGNCKYNILKEIIYHK